MDALTGPARHLARRHTPPPWIGSALSTLRPFDLGYDLVRLGPDHDGGYLVPDADLDRISVLLSPGVETTWGFEADLADRYGVASVMCDGSADPPPDLTGLQTFERRWLAARTGADRVSLADWVDEHAAPEDKDLMLQMDVEGAEYAVLRATPAATLARFRIIVIEWHDLQRLSNVYGYSRRAPALRKLARLFDVAHVHLNNCCGEVAYAGYVLPRALEVTYLRKDLARRREPRADVLHPLDRDCVPAGPAARLPAGWPARRPRP